MEHVLLGRFRAGNIAEEYPCAGAVGVAGEVGDPAVAALVLGPGIISWCDGDFLLRSYGEWCVGIAPPLVPEPVAGPADPGAVAGGGGMFWFGIGQEGSHGSAGQRARIHNHVMVNNLKINIFNRLLIGFDYRPCTGIIIVACNMPLEITLIIKGKFHM